MLAPILIIEAHYGDTYCNGCFTGYYRFGVTVRGIPEPCQAGVEDNMLVVHSGARPTSIYTRLWAVARRHLVCPLDHPLFDHDGSFL